MIRLATSNLKFAKSGSSISNVGLRCREKVTNVADHVERSFTVEQQKCMHHLSKGCSYHSLIRTGSSSASGDSGSLNVVVANEIRSIKFIGAFSSAAPFSSFTSLPQNNRQKRNFWSFSGKKESTTSADKQSVNGTSDTGNVGVIDNETIFESSPNAELTGNDFKENVDIGPSSTSSSFQDSLSSPDVPSAPSVDETLDQLFAESQKLSEGGSSALEVIDGAANSGIIFDPLWYNPADIAVVAVNSFQSATGLNYAYSIIGLTLALRVVLFPILANGQKASARMAHLQPELNRMKQKYEQFENPTLEQRQEFIKGTQGLFKQYEVNPFKAMALPLMQAPIFMGMFFGLKKMPDLFPEELSTGGMYWFVDLTVADPLYVLPLVCSFSFLASIESNKDTMLATNSVPGQGEMMINVFRILALAMIPVTINFHTAMLCYWTTNNILTTAQVMAFKQPAVKELFGIWELPKPVPGAGGGNAKEDLSTALNNIVKRVQGEPTTETQKMKVHNEKIEDKRMAKDVLSSVQQPRKRRNKSRRTRR